MRHRRPRHTQAPTSTRPLRLVKWGRVITDRRRRPNPQTQDGRRHRPRLKRVACQNQTHLAPPGQSLPLDPTGAILHPTFRAPRFISAVPGGRAAARPGSEPPMTSSGRGGRTRGGCGPQGVTSLPGTTAISARNMQKCLSKQPFAGGAGQAVTSLPF
jgi:hypothetical protein